MSGLFGAIAGLVIAFGLIGTVLVTNVVRGNRISSKFPDAIVLRSGSTRELRQTFTQFSELLHFDRSSTSLFGFFCIVADEAGIALWAGTDSSFANLSWASVASVKPTEVEEQVRESNGIEVVADSPDGQCRLPLMVLGRGALGAFPQTVGEVETLCSRLELLRSARG